MTAFPVSFAADGVSDALLAAAAVPSAGGPKHSVKIKAMAAPSGGGGGGAGSAAAGSATPAGPEADEPPGPKRAKEVADIAYDAKNLRPGQVVVVNGSRYEVMDVFHDPSTGLDAVTLRDPDGRIAVGFGGTSLTDLGDLRTDHDNYFNRRSAQYDQAESYMRGVKATLPGESIYASGHSLGGGLATYGAGMSGLPAAGINGATIGQHHLDRFGKHAPPGAEVRLINYNHIMDPVSQSRELAQAGILPSAGSRGRQLGMRLFMVPSDWEPGWLRNHSLRAFRTDSVMFGTTEDGRHIKVIAAPDDSLIVLEMR